ncbi:hypothetical protein NMG60_11035808 [Bertholletia excelsa]
MRDESGSADGSTRKYKGIRKRKWGKWVSEIRVPRTKDRLWLGSYSNPEAAAVAYEVASFYCHYLRGGRHRRLVVNNYSVGSPLLNFPAAASALAAAPGPMSPTSIQKVASDAGMAVDAQFVNTMTTPQTHFSTPTHTTPVRQQQQEVLDISVEDYL